MSAAARYPATVKAVEVLALPPDAGVGLMSDDKEHAERLAAVGMIARGENPASVGLAPRVYATSLRWEGLALVVG